MIAFHYVGICISDGSDKVGKIPLAQKHIIAPNTVKDLGDMDIESFAVSHDAAQPQFYQVHHNNKTFCIITDTVMLTTVTKENLFGSPPNNTHQCIGTFFIGKVTLIP